MQLNFPQWLLVLIVPLFSLGLFCYGVSFIFSCSGLPLSSSPHKVLSAQASGTLTGPPLFLSTVSQYQMESRQNFLTQSPLIIFQSCFKHLGFSP